MVRAGRSLRSMVQDWLSPDPKRGFRVSHYGRSRIGRYVGVVADNATGSKAIFFYRHRDGRWCIFPQEPVRPATRIVEIQQ
ncbi:hypothetical protein QFZ89_004072 [Paraburkholderia youngii]